MPMAEDGLLAEWQAGESSVYALQVDVANAQVALQKTPEYLAVQDAKEKLEIAEAHAKARQEKLIQTMLENDLKSLETFDVKLTLKRSPGSVLVTNESVIAGKYLKEKITVSLDKRAIAEDLKAGVPVNGCELEHTWSLVVTKKDVLGIG